MTARFEDVSGPDLDGMNDDELDQLEFGIVGFDAKGITTRYNTTEANLAALRRESVIGSAYFDEVAQCMNNYLVAQRFEDEAEIDDVIAYVLTLRMRPTPVHLRLLKGNGFSSRYILIKR